MILYHGSYTEISVPDLAHTRNNVDFGPGFYTTPYEDQARKWCSRFKRRGQEGIISIYAFDDEATLNLSILRFDTYSEDWLDFILTCRKGNDHSTYDLVIGGVANDRVFNTVELYYDGLIDKREALQRLRYEKPNLQICFRTNAALAHLHFEGSEKA